MAGLSEPLATKSALLRSNSDSPDVNQMFLHPFLVYNWKFGAGLGANIELIQNWKAFRTTLSGGTSLGKQQMQFVIGPRFHSAASH